MPDLAKAGGIAEGKRIADIADAHYIPIAPHNVSSPLGMMAACHVLASVPNFLLLEFHARDIPWWNDLCDGDQPFIENGLMTVSERPGIGVELNDSRREVAAVEWRHLFRRLGSSRGRLLLIL